MYIYIYLYIYTCAFVCLHLICLWVYGTGRTNADELQDKATVVRDHEDREDNEDEQPVVVELEQKVMLFSEREKRPHFHLVSFSEKEEFS